MSNDVVMVAIPKELRDELDIFVVSWSDGENPRINAMLDALRAAPETVSLEGVERLKNALGACLSIDPRDAKVLLDMIDDLPHPVAPVQPSAVVSRELWHAAEVVLDAFKRRVAGYQLDYEMETLRIETLEQALLDSKNQLPQPVAPVQSGGVVSRE